MESASNCCAGAGGTPQVGSPRPTGRRGGPSGGWLGRGPGDRQAAPGQAQADDHAAGEAVLLQAVVTSEVEPEVRERYEAQLRATTVEVSAELGRARPTGPAAAPSSS